MFEYNLPIPVHIHSFTTTLQHQNNNNTPFVFEDISVGSRQGKRKGNGWSDETQLKYLAFICLFKEEMQSLQGKQLWKYYKLLSLFIKCKNANQCRIYHRQLIKEHHTINAILSFYALPITVYSSTFKHYAEEITKMGDPQKIDDIQNKKQKYSKNNSASTISINSSLVNKTLEPAQSQDKKEELPPTGLSYQQELQQHQPITGRSRLKYGRSLLNYSYIQSIQQDLPDNRREDWMQCHRLFLAWTNKLHSLLSSE